MSHVINMTKTIAFGCDHAGFEMKEHLKNIVSDWDYKSVDMGTHNSDAVDYSDFIAPVVQEVRNNAVGILICGSGIGISIGANRFKGIRAALCHDPLSAQLSREHNDANILALGSRIIGEDEAIACLKTFLETPFAGGRHLRRIEKLDSLGDNDA